MGKMEVVASGGLVRLTPGKGAGPPLSESSLLSFEHHPPLTRSLDLFSFSTQESEEKAGLWKCCGTERDNIGDIPVVGASGQFELGGNGSSGQLAAAAQKCRPPYCEAARAARSRCRGRDKVQHRHCATPHRGQHCATHRGQHCATHNAAANICEYEASPSRILGRGLNEGLARHLCIAARNMNERERHNRSIDKRGFHLYPLVLLQAFMKPGKLL